MNNAITQLARMPLAGILRILGALIVAAGLVAHLLEGWSTWSDFSRFYVLLGATGLLAAAGVCASRFLAENKSARVFVGLSLLAVTATVTTLGGLLHEWVQWQGALSVSVTPTQWSGSALIWSTAALVMLGVPVIWFTFSVLARKQATNLASAFVICAGLILLPIRHSVEVGMLIALAFSIPVWYWLRYGRGEILFSTAEGRFALLSLFVPAVIMLVRSVWLYEADLLLLWVLASICFVALHFLRAALPGRTLWRFLATMVTLAVAAFLGGLSMQLLSPYVPQQFELNVFGFIAGGLLWLMGWAEGSVRSGFAVAAGCVVLLCALLGLGFIDAWTGTVMVLLSALGVAAVGWLAAERNLLWMSAGAALLALLPRFLEFGSSIDFTHWLTLGVLGIGVLGLSIVVERRGRQADA